MPFSRKLARSFVTLAGNRTPLTLPKLVGILIWVIPVTRVSILDSSALTFLTYPISIAQVKIICQFIFIYFLWLIDRLIAGFRKNLKKEN